MRVGTVTRALVLAPRLSLLLGCGSSGDSHAPPSAAAPSASAPSLAPAPSSSAPVATHGSDATTSQPAPEPTCPRAAFKNHNVLVVTSCDGREQRFKDYDRWSSIDEAAFSTEGDWLFVRWKGEKPALRLDIYDVAHGKRTARFIPGFGGDLAWTPGHRIYHDWGCGTECLVWRVYDTSGKKLHEEGALVWPSPDHRYAAFAAGPPPDSWVPGPVPTAFFRVRDLDRDREVRIPIVPRDPTAVGLKLESCAWLSDGRIDVGYLLFNEDDARGGGTSEHQIVALPTELMR